MERSEVSRRLKAARALRGVKVTELAQRDPLKRNGISANLIGETERQERDAREMELRTIAGALDIPESFLLSDDPFEFSDLSIPARLDHLEGMVTDLLQRATQDFPQPAGELGHRIADAPTNPERKEPTSNPAEADSR